MRIPPHFPSNCLAPIAVSQPHLSRYVRNATSIPSLQQHLLHADAADATGQHTQPPDGDAAGSHAAANANRPAGSTGAAAAHAGAAGDAARAAQ